MWGVSADLAEETAMRTLAMETPTTTSNQLSVLGDLRLYASITLCKHPNKLISSFLTGTLPSMSIQWTSESLSAPLRPKRRPGAGCHLQSNPFSLLPHVFGCGRRLYIPLTVFVAATVQPLLYDVNRCECIMGQGGCTRSLGKRMVRSGSAEQFSPRSVLGGSSKKRWSGPQAKWVILETCFTETYKCLFLRLHIEFSRNFETRSHLSKWCKHFNATDCWEDCEIPKSL